MKLRILIAVLLILALGYWYLSRDFDRVQSTLYLNADIVTMEADTDPSADAVYVKDGVIKAIGTSDELSTYSDEAELVVDLKGKTLLPGFIDPHTHPPLVAFFRDLVDLSGFTHSTNQSIWEHLGAVVKEKPKGEWIVCKGLDPVLVPDLVTPSKQFR